MKNVLKKTDNIHSNRNIGGGMSIQQKRNLNIQIKKVLFFTLIFLLLESCQENNQQEIIPKEAKKLIITNYYEPLLNNGEWICGKESSEIGYYPDTTYYDEYGNVVLSINKYDRILNIYYSPKEEKLSEQHISSSYSTRKKHKGTVKYLRNEKGLLLERKASGNVGVRNRGLVGISTHFLAEYDNNDNRIKETEGNIIRLYKKLPSKEGQDIRLCQSINKNNQDSYNYIVGLEEQITEISDSETQLIQRIIKEYYKYGYISIKEDYTYSYDANGLLIKENCKEKWMQESYLHNLTEEERREYIIENCYRKNDYTFENTIKEWQYDSKGNIIDYSKYHCYSSKEEYINDSDKYYKLPFFDKKGTYFKESKYHYKYEYKYNEKGDWIERVTYEGRYDSQSQTSEIIPFLITVREIEYYE